MKNEDLQSLAQTFAEETDNDVNHKDFAEAYAMNFLQWLSERYCIVSREKIKKWSDESEFTVFDSIDLIEIFNDLFGSDLFTDKDEKQ